MGRIINLTSSIKHKKGFKYAGEPAGSRCARKLLKLKELLISTIENQIGNAKVNAITRWEVRPIV